MEVTHDGSYEAPQGDTESILAAIWSEVLKVTPVGRRDNFFELGGQSVQGMTVLEKVAEKFAVEPSLVALFQHPTLQSLGQLIEKLTLEGNETEDAG